MSDDLVKALKEIHGIVNNFTITGTGVSGNLRDGYAVDFSPVANQEMDLPEGPEIPEQPE